ncbi:hypothetical protein TNCV_3753591 [Trichonephila clavipes]|nr:hypothetical protein TNCV_3753591 [Trichonephila clavipes]
MISIQRGRKGPEQRTCSVEHCPRTEGLKTKIICLGCQRNESLIPRIKEKRVNENDNIRKHSLRPVEEGAKRERNRSDVTRVRVEERRKGAKSPKTRSRRTKTQLGERIAATFFMQRE